jgi:hypothetical protein
MMPLQFDSEPLLGGRGDIFVTFTWTDSAGATPTAGINAEGDPPATVCADAQTLMSKTPAAKGRSFAFLTR